MLDVVHRGRKDAFIGCDDAPRHVVGRHAGVLEGDADHRHADIGENVGGGLHRRNRPEDHDQQRHHDKV